MHDRGRRQLGSDVSLGVQCVNGSNVPSAPTAAPLMTITKDDGSLVLEKRIPPLSTSTGFFGYEQSLNDLFEVGRYFVRYEWDVLGTTYTNEGDTFEVLAGGNDDGPILSMYYVDRPEGADWVFSQVQNIGVTANRGPQI